MPYIEGHIAGKGKGWDSSTGSLAPELTYLTHPIPLLTKLAQEALCYSTPLSTPAILNPVDFHSSQAPLLLGAGSGLSGWS